MLCWGVSKKKQAQKLMHSVNGCECGDCKESVSINRSPTATTNASFSDRTSSPTCLFVSSSTGERDLPDIQDAVSPCGSPLAGFIANPRGGRSSSGPQHGCAATQAVREASIAKGREFVVNEDFTVGTTVGTGTFGRVKVVKLKSDVSQTPMALKMVKKSEVVRMRQGEHIKNEKDLLMGLSHPFIVNLLATFQDKYRVYLLMEFVNGGELFTYLRNSNKMHADEARFFAAEVLLVFEYLHGFKVAYRDLKPENVLIASDGHIKLTDFGFAKKIERKTFTLCGTPEYLAPEIIASKGYNMSVDWWALGILIFEMLDGMPPFHGNETVIIYQKIMRGKIEFGRRFDSHQKALIEGLLQRDAEKRLGSRGHDAKDVKDARWFKSIDWQLAAQKGLKPKRIPPVTKLDDTSQFDRYPDSVEAAKPISHENQGLFRTFSGLSGDVTSSRAPQKSTSTSSLMVP